VTLPAPIDGLEQPREGALLDRYGRAHTYLRVSVTDRCNYRCTYCMPAEGFVGMPRADLLTYEEITRVVSALAGMGVRRVRLTGGEPLVRAALPSLVASIARIEGIADLSMTTNGHLLASKAKELVAAGLHRVNVSLDAVDAALFRAMTRGGDLSRVLRGIDQALEAGLRPVKINTVVVRGENHEHAPAVVERFASYGEAVEVRFIEYMPFASIGDARKHVPAAEMRMWWPDATPLGRGPGGPAVRYRLPSGQVIGFISPITEHFCEACNRLRLQADGDLRTCLSRDRTPSLRDLLRGGADDETLRAVLRGMVWQKVAGHEAHELAGQAFEGIMTQVGG
jgi:cyclic pyranopterin phosphate synthase